MTNFLSDYAELVRGKTYKSALCSESEGIPLLGLGAIEREGGFKSSFKRYQGDTDPRTIVNSGDLFFSLKDLTQAGHLLGSVARLPEIVPQGRLTQDTLKLSLSEIDPTYVYWVLRSPQARRFYKSLATGTTNLGLAREDFLSLPIPPFTTERKFTVELLERIESKIELNQKMNQTLEEIAKAIFKSWFVDFDPVRAKAEGRPTGLPPEISDLFPDELVDSEIGEIPKGWEVTPLQECAIEIESGRRPKGGIDKSLQQGIPSVGAESIAPAGEFDFSKVKYVTAEFAEKMKKGRVQNFDIALYKDGGKPGQFIPRVGIYGDGFPFDHFYVNEHVFLLRSEQLGQPFLYRLVSSPAFLDQLIAKGSAKAAQPGLNQTEVVESTFVCPSENTITVFNNKIRPLLERQFLLGKENEILSDLRDTLLPKLISGELRIPDAEKFLEEAGI